MYLEMVFGGIFLSCLDSLARYSGVRLYLSAAI
jgi:hypothetical protein